MSSRAQRESLDFTEDLTEAQLAEASFGEEIAVMISGPGPMGSKQFGIIVGYTDPQTAVTSLTGDIQDEEAADTSLPGSFVIDLVEKRPTRPHGEEHWVETGKTVQLRRSEFVVFGPANREPGNRAQTDGEFAAQALSGHLDPPGVQFLAAAIDLLNATQTDTGEAAFEVRLDISLDDERYKEESRAFRDGPAPRKYRLLVRPTMQPFLHDEIEQVLRIANEHELCVWHSNAGLEVHTMGDFPS